MILGRLGCLCLLIALLESDIELQLLHYPLLVCKHIERGATDSFRCVLFMVPRSLVVYRFVQAHVGLLLREEVLLVHCDLLAIVPRVLIARLLPVA